MHLYDPTLARTPGLIRRRSATRTIVATVVLVVCGLAIVGTISNFSELVEDSREGAEEASRPRYRAMGGLGLLPLGIIVLAVTFGAFAVQALLGWWTRTWVLAQTNTPLRRRFEGYHALASP